MPWTDEMLPSEFRLSAYESLENVNYCRNLMAKEIGPWCFVFTDTGLREEPCTIRKCRSMFCKVAGTANDYSGHLTVTRY